MQTTSPRPPDAEATEHTLSLTASRERIRGVGFAIGEPVRLVFEVVSEDKDIVVPFELHDVVLP